MKAFIRKLRDSTLIPQALFWSWNAVFIAVVYMGLLPLHLAALVAETFEGFIPVELAISTMLLILIPGAATFAGAFWLRNDPKKLFRFFYGVEAPLFVLAMIRLFLIRELTPASAYVLALFLIACGAYAYGLARDADTARTTAGLSARLAFDAICLLVGFYVFAVLAFYSFPAAAALIKGFFSFEWLADVVSSLRHFEVFVAMLFMMMIVLFFLSGTLFVALPFVFVTLYSKRWLETFRTAAVRLGKLPAAAITAGVLLAGIANYGLSNIQPQRRIFTLLETPPATDAERRALLEQSEEIREGLLNAYLAPYRYASPLGKEDHISEMYQKVFSFNESAGLAVQDLFNIFSRPLLYDGGELADERAKAAKLYEAFFDTPIQKGERKSILRALETTYESDGREAGLLNEGGRKVRVERQDVNVVEHGAFAEIELHEVYENRTHEQQEIFYYFSLPETAVVTGLWLGDTDDRSQRYNFTVSSRGAAQAVYREEVKRRVDPALLEQVGPRQYRLRAFPVPPKPARRWSGAEQQPQQPERPRLHLWLTYSVLPHDGAWPLPQLAEKRNVYFEDCELTINGVPRDRDDEDEWLPTSIPAVRPQEIKPMEIALAPNLSVRADPITGGKSVPGDGRRYAIVLDRSHSMGRHTEELAGIFTWLDERIAGGSDIDLYLTSSQHRGEAASRIDEPKGFDPKRVVYFGGANAQSMLEQFQTLRGDKSYDAILILTDDGSFELAKDSPLPKSYGAPLWMIHAGGRIPPSYDDSTQAAVERSGGGVTTDIQRAFRQLALAEEHATSTAFIGFEDGYRWSIAGLGTGTSPLAQAEGADPQIELALEKIAARQFVRASMMTLDLSKLSTLDRIHGVAQRWGIVSPYSSMIVLVNDRQKEALAQAEKADDRFDREVESGQEQLTTPLLGGFGGNLTATPEPEEWALIAVGLCILYFAFVRRRGAGFSFMRPS